MKPEWFDEVATFALFFVGAVLFLGIVALFYVVLIDLGF